MSNLAQITLSQHLSTLPRLDKTHFVSDFVQEQRVHAKSYVLEGRAVCPMGSEVEAPDAFGTPVLKPRVSAKVILGAAPAPRSPATLAGGRLNHLTIKANKRKRSDSTAVVKRLLPRVNQQSQVQRNKPLCKKPDSEVDIKDEQAWRTSMNNERLCLAELKFSIGRRERRDRKRAKRAMVDPGAENGNNARIAKNTKAKVPAGFALMHGFMATNVGASRLTV